MDTVLVTHGIPSEGLAELRQSCQVLMPPPGDAYTRSELQALLPTADAVLACGALDGELIRLGARLKIISNYGAGYDRIDVAQASACGIPVTAIPDATSGATAELALALILAVERRVGEMTLRARQEPPEELFGMGKYMGRTLRGLRLGIIGLGHIGRETAQMASAFGMKTAYYSRRKAGAEAGTRYVSSLEALLRESDVLSLHCPLTSETRGMLDRERLLLMPKGASIINTARGGILDYDALYELLCSGHLSGAGLDVYPDEPHMPSHLLTLPQVVTTPHIGTNTASTREDMAREAAAHIREALSGVPVTGVVNSDWERHIRRI